MPSSLWFCQTHDWKYHMFGTFTWDSLHVFILSHVSAMHVFLRSHAWPRTAWPSLPSYQPSYQPSYLIRLLANYTIFNRSVSQRHGTLTQKRWISTSIHQENWQSLDWPEPTLTPLTFMVPGWFSVVQTSLEVRVQDIVSVHVSLCQSPVVQFPDPDVEFKLV